eukprot:4040620-Ditylum_brightwellii.AAC.1
MDSVLQLVGLRNPPQHKERRENKQEDESQQDKLGLNCNKQILVATIVNTGPPEIPEEEEVQGTIQNQAGQSDSSHFENLNEKSGQKGNSTFLEQGSIKSTVVQSTAENTSNSDKIGDTSDEEYVQYGSEDGMSLGK